MLETGEALRENLQNLRITYSPCDKLYHKDVFIGLRMTEGKIYEDMEIIPKWVERARIVIYDPTPKYHYVMTDSSTIRGRYNLRRMAEADVAWEKAEDYKVRHPELYDEAMGRYVAICLNIIHKSNGVKACDLRRKQMIEEVKSCIARNVIQKLSKKEKIKLKLLQFSPFVFELVMWIFDKRGE